LPIALVIASCG
jgi:DNA-directed RNA polymerase subunit alpha